MTNEEIAEYLEGLYNTVDKLSERAPLAETQAKLIGIFGGAQVVLLHEIVKRLDQEKCPHTSWNRLDFAEKASCSQCGLLLNIKVFEDFKRRE